MPLIKELRRKRGLSQESAAVAIGISVKSLSDYENKKTQPSTKTLEALADFYGVTTDELLGRTS